MKPKKQSTNLPAKVKAPTKREVLPNKKAKQKSAEKGLKTKPQAASNPAVTASAGRFKRQAQTSREDIRAQKTNWPSAASRTEARLESKRNSNVRRNKGTGKRSNRTSG